MVDRIVSTLGLLIVVILHLKMDAYPAEAQIMPGALLTAGGFLFLILAFQAFILKSNRAEVFKNFPILNISIIIVVLFMYFFLIQKLGFYVSSWLFFMLITTWFNSEKSKITSWILGTFFILFLYLIFEMLLRVPLPRGAFL